MTFEEFLHTFDSPEASGKDHVFGYCFKACLRNLGQYLKEGISNIRLFVVRVAKEDIEVDFAGIKLDSNLASDGYLLFFIDCYSAYIFVFDLFVDFVVCYFL